MRIVHTADWHIGKIVNEFNMLEDQTYILDRMVAFLTEQRADVLIVAGDLYDRSVPSADAVAMLDRVFSRIVLEVGIPVLAVAGNHDSPERLDFGNSILAAGGLHIEGTPASPVQRVTLEDPYGPVCFYLLPYLTPAHARALYPEAEIRTYDDAYDAMMKDILPSLDQNQRNVLVGHGFFEYLSEGADATGALDESEVSVGGSDLVDAKRLSVFDYVALGHLHSPHRVGLDSIRYAGSLLKYAVDEAGQKKSVTLIELGEKGSSQITEHSLTPRRDLRIVEGRFSELMRRENQVGFSVEDYIFVHLTDEAPVMDAVARLRAVFPNILGLQYTVYDPAEDVQAISPRTIRTQGIEQLFAGFYEKFSDTPLDPAQTKLVAEVVREVEEANHAAD